MSSPHIQDFVDSGALLFDRFQCIEALGRGEFGTVYRVRDQLLSRDVALKVLHSVDPSTLMRFKREFRVARAFAHPNLIQLGELFEGDGQWAFSMERIDGVNVLDWLTDRSLTQVNDEGSVRECLAQLASGLAALHRAGVVHRDIKPCNVLVTSQGRVVILDFGLLMRRDEFSESNGQYAVGTWAYMAPEQAQGEASSASDMFGVGVILYEALVGQKPFSGDMLQIHFAKLSQPPPPPSALLEAVSPELDRLTMELLSKQPEARPTARGLLDRLEREYEPAPAPPCLRDGPFVGRAAELAGLVDLLDTADGHARLVLIEGSPGVGKSALLEQFLLVAKQLAQPPVVLSGRCHAFEHVRYNAFDEIFAQLTRLAGSHISAAPQSRAAALTQLVAALHPSIRHPPESSQRSRLFDSLLGALEFLAEQRRVILTIDDLQWADRDSLLLLSHLLKYSRSHFLIVAVQRHGAAESGNPGAILARMPLRRLSLEALPHEDARCLAISLLGTQQQALSRVLEQAAGHPLYLQELALLSDQPRMLADALTVERAIAWRASELESEARRALEIVCVAGTPLSYGVLADAAGLDKSSGTLYRVLSQLRELRLLLPGARDAAASPYHDRVRETVVAQLDSTQLRRAHIALAVAWQSSSLANPENVARHFLAAHEPSRALLPLQHAAEQAFGAGAYVRAIALCSQRLGLTETPGSHAQRFEIVKLYSDALAFNGAYAQAAAVLQTFGGQSARDDGDRRALLIKSAERLLQSAAVDEGLAAAISALRAVDLDLPSSELQLMAALAGNHLGERLQRAAPHWRTPRPDPKRVQQLDTLWRLIQPLYFADLQRSALTGARHLRLAGSVGDPGHLALSCAANSVMEATREPDSKRSEELIEAAADWCRKAPEPSTRAYVAFARGARALFSGNTREAIVSLKRAEEIYRTQCPREAWLQTTARGSYLRALFFRGWHRPFREVADAWTRDARSRSDAAGFAQYAILGQAALRHLMNDEPQQALEELEHAARPWETKRFGIVPWLALLTSTTMVSYCPTSPTIRASFERRARIPLSMRMLIGVVPAGNSDE